ncbi:MAG: hypothetical protein ACE5JR_00035 [Gemmatimonadota bacterium]
MRSLPAAQRLREQLVRLLGTRRVEVEAGGDEGKIAVIRVGPSVVHRLLAPSVREAVVARARAVGFRYATLDLSLREAAEGMPSAQAEGGLA